MSLRDLQLALRDNILSGDRRVVDLLRPSSSDGLALYQLTYRARLRERLAEAYPTVAAWLGDDDFDRGCARYIESHPALSGDQGGYGDMFGVAAREMYPHDPEVADLAWLDRAMTRARDASDRPPLDVTDLSPSGAESVVLAFTPTLSMGILTTNAVAIWSAIQENRRPPTAAVSSESVAVRVWRYGRSPRLKFMGGEEALALGQGLTGKSLATICQTFARTNAYEAPAKAKAQLLIWLHEGLIVGAN